MSSALVFNQESNIADITASDDEDVSPQELLDIPAPSTSTSHTGGRVFPITTLPKEDNFKERKDYITNEAPTVRTISDLGHITTSPKELKAFNYHNIPSPSTSASSKDRK